MSRTRTRYFSTPENYSWGTDYILWYNNDPQNEVTGTTGQYTGSDNTYSSDESFTDEVHSGYRRRSAKGEIMLGPRDSLLVQEFAPVVSVAGSAVELVDDYGNHFWHTYNGTMKSRGMLPTSSYPDLTLDTTAIFSQAVTQAHANISASDAMLWASLGEAKKTVLGIQRILVKVKKCLKSKRKLIYELRKLKDVSNLADVYMTIRYELRPLYYDVNNYIDAFSNSHPNHCRQTFRGYAETEASAEQEYVSSFSHFKFTCLNTKHRRAYVRAGVLTDVDLDTLQAFGIYDIPQSIWELMPYSFVIDWFANVGSVIASHTPNAGFTSLGSWATTTIESTYTSRITEVTPANANVRSCSFSGSPAYTKKIKRVTRVINPSVPLLPSLRVNLDCLKLLDLAIMIRNII